MAICGVIRSNGTVSVTLTWISGGPDPVISERVYCAVYGVPESVKDVTIPGPIPPHATRSLTLNGLIPGGAPYGWTVQSFWARGVMLESTQGTFETPRAPSIERNAASNLACRTP